MKLILLTVIAATLTFSCASATWKVQDVSLEKREWRVCSEILDGPEKHQKGFCYISQECKKKKCRPLPLFCAWGDIVCMDKWKLLDKKLR